MEEPNHISTLTAPEKRFGCLHVFGIALLAALIAVGATIFMIKIFFFPSAFTPVALTPKEEQVLTAKLESIDLIGPIVTSPQNNMPQKADDPTEYDPNMPLTPEPYDETGLKREINFTERELNALLAKNTELASKLAFDLSDDLISAKLLLPVDEDFPFFGGQILRARTGVTLSYEKGKPIVMLRGVTLMGVPIPNAWLGGIKNIDLVNEFGNDYGFWKAFSDGVEDIKIEEGLFKLKLNE
ncbi:hypothetical protein QUF70_13590 [Desulfobacterales bacterium HSG17]|nr:hypothetical protein [Desulfobacterales bacterium HSG17]